MLPSPKARNGRRVELGLERGGDAEGAAGVEMPAGVGGAVHHVASKGKGSMVSKTCRALASKNLLACHCFTQYNCRATTQEVSCLEKLSTS